MIYRDQLLEIAKDYPMITVAEIENMISFQFKEIKRELKENPGATCFMGKLGEIGPPKAVKKKLDFDKWVEDYKIKTGQENDRTPLYHNSGKSKAKMEILSLDLEDSNSEHSSS